MTANEAIKKIKVMLGVEQVVETAETKIQLAEATLVDGTIVKVDGEFEVGKQLLVVTAEGDIAAPEGIHETTDGLLVTVDAQGVITNLEETTKESEEVEAKASTELSEDFVNQIVNILDNKFKEFETKLQTLNHEFSAFKNEPAGKKITNNLNDVQKSEGDLATARYEKLVEFRNQTKNF
jgi:tRNA(Phe) wybutosine-synthesizing methylase Tyw3